MGWFNILVFVIEFIFVTLVNSNFLVSFQSMIPENWLRMFSPPELQQYVIIIIII